jgi:hypothetical protein
MEFLANIMALRCQAADTSGVSAPAREDSNENRRSGA